MTSRGLADLALSVIGSRRARVHTLEPRSGAFVPWPPGCERLAELARPLGVARLYRQQALALELGAANRDFVVATRTSSGKSLCYALPVLQAILSEPAARAMVLFPTKALARDQANKLERLAPQGVRIGVFDGDTPASERTGVRKHAQIVISNPDMLHLSVLPNHANWRPFLQSLRYVVLDELHVYRGVFGSHVAGILRRLLRLCRWHRSHPTVVATSATVDDPANLFQQLTGRRGTVVEDDTAPQGSRSIVLLGPSDEGSYSPTFETARLFAALVSQRVRTLAFCRSRAGSEAVLKQARRLLRDLSEETLIDSYRGGYTAKERRCIERRLLDGELVGLACTNALELGIDIGGLDAVVLNGFPGTVTSFWQQAGRAGRSGRDGLAVLIARPDPLEQALVTEPRLLLEAPIEAATIRLGNPHVLSGQIKCMAHERPVSAEELARFHPDAVATAEALVESQELVKRAAGYFYPSDRSPAGQVDIRGAGGRTIVLRSEGSVVGEMEEWRALREAHSGAVYLHRGQTYIVDELDLAESRAELRPADPPDFTRALVTSVVSPNAVVRESGLFSLLGLTVTTLVRGYVRVSYEDGSVVGEEELDLPPDTIDTIGIRLNLKGLNREHLMTVHALEHALISLAPLFAGCDRGDLESAWYAMTPDTGEAAVYVFDRTPGGVGLSERLMDSADEWIRAARSLLAGCVCQEGCPRCLYLSGCPDANRLLDKRGALEWLQGHGSIIVP